MWALPDVSQGENHQGIDSSFLCPKVEGPFLVNTQRVGKEVSGKGERPGCLYVYGSLCLEVFVGGVYRQHILRNRLTRWLSW